MPVDKEVSHKSTNILCFQDRIPEKCSGPGAFFFVDRKDCSLYLHFRRCFNECIVVFSIEHCWEVVYHEKALSLLVWVAVTQLLKVFLAKCSFSSRVVRPESFFKVTMKLLL